MKAVISTDLTNILENTPDDIPIDVQVYPATLADFGVLESFLGSKTDISFDARPDQGYIALRATGPQIKKLADHHAVRRIEFDVMATDEPVEEMPPGGRAAERYREFIDQRYPDDSSFSPLPEEYSDEEPDNGNSA